MDKNLPFVNVGFIDNAYNNRVLPLLGKIDNGHLFKWFLVLIWKIAALAFLLGGVYLTIAGIFGDAGYIKMNITNELFSGGQKAGASFGLVIGLVLSLVCAWYLYSNTKKRTDELNSQEYDDLLHFIFLIMIPRTITLAGEIAFTLIMYAGLMQIIAGLDGAAAYAPLLSYGDLFMQIPGVNMAAALVPSSVHGDYDNFINDMRMGIMGVAAAFIVLIAYYIYREVYNYGMKLVCALIAFLPKFALPIAIRKKAE